MPAPRRVSNAQLVELLMWMKTHPQVARRTQLGGAEYLASSRKSWQELASRLNAIESEMIKSGKEWRLYWNDLKCKVRKKELHLRQNRKTGGASSEAKILTNIEDQILHFIGTGNVARNEAGSNVNECEEDSPVVMKTETPANEPSTSHRRFVVLQHPRPTNRALQIQERRLALEKEKLEEARRYHRKVLEEQRSFHDQVLRTMDRLVDTLTSQLQHPD